MRGKTVLEREGSVNAAAPSMSAYPNEHTGRQVSLWQRLRRTMWHVLARQLTLLCVIALKIAGVIGRKRRPIPEAGCEILLTGRFDSQNWILNHLGPLSASKECSRLWMVSTNPVPELPKVTAIYPPKWLIRILGPTAARLLTFAWAGIRKRPHVVGGFHLMYNGIAAAVIGRLAGARSMYFCVGGTEVSNDGVGDESNCFMRSNQAATKARNRRLRIVSSFDTIITMGTRAARFFQDNGIDSDFHVVSGGIDLRRFYPSGQARNIDVVSTARLTAVKRIDILLHALKLVADRFPNLRAVIVGDGELRLELQRLANELGIGRNVDFVGHTSDVQQWLRSSRVFVLTSDLEGLPLSAMEAMMCGVPVVVSNVGDLADLVDEGINGYLVPRRSPEILAKRIVQLLSDEDRWKQFSKAAHQSALRYELQATASQWDHIIAGFRAH